MTGRAAQRDMTGRHNWADWSRRASFTCGTCGAVSNFLCHHQRASLSALAKGDHVRVQMEDETFAAVIRVIVVSEFGGMADVEPDGEPGRVVSVSFGTGSAASQITPIGRAA